MSLRGKAEQQSKSSSRAIVEGLTFYGRRNIIRQTSGKNGFRRRTRVAWKPGGESSSSFNIALEEEKEKVTQLEKKMKLLSQDREKVKTRIDQLLHRFKNIET